MNNQLVECKNNTLTLILNQGSLMLLFLLMFNTIISAQVLDGVVAVVGASPVLQSDIDMKRMQSKMDSTVKFNTCTALEDLLYQKLLLTQAIKDSVDVSDDQVEAELEKRLRYYTSQFGSTKAFEEFVGKSIEKFKEDSRDELADVLRVQKMQAKITESVTVSPAEVRSFFQSIPADSVPYINAEIEVGHILKSPVINPELKKYAKDKIEALRAEIISGKKDFATAAIINSQDPGSAQNGGLYKDVQRGTFDPVFDAMAFRIKEGEVSPVFETPFGYHILKVESRRGDLIDVRHILIIPQPSPDDMYKAKTILDSIAVLVQKDSISISEAASRFSDDEDTKKNAGLIANPYTGSTKFEMSALSQIDPNLVFLVDKLKPGELSVPTLTQTHDGKRAYHIIFVKSRTEPHRANLREDYQRIQDEALAHKKDRIVNVWIKKKLSSTYINVSAEYKECKFINPWVN